MRSRRLSPGATRPSLPLPVMLLVTALLAPTLPALPAPQVGSEPRGWDAGDNEGDEPQVLLSAARRSFDPLGRLRAAGARVRRPMPVGLDSLSGVTFGSAHKRSMEPVGFGVSSQKRNFDEIDRIGFNEFMKKKNMDEIDRSSLDSFAKRRLALDSVLEDLLEHRYGNQ